MNKTIQIKGINRNNSITNNADGNCEEVMNLRPKQGRWEAVMRKKKAYKNDWIDKLEYPAHIVKYHQHKVGDKINNIYIIHEEGDGKKSDFRIKGVWVKEVGIDFEPVLLWQIETGVKYADVDSSLGIDIESIGNFLSFNLPEVTTFLWKDGEYQRSKQTEVSSPKINMEFQSRFSSSSARFSFYRLEGYGAEIGGYSYREDPNTPGQLTTGVVFNSFDRLIPTSAFCLQNSIEKNLPIQFCNIKFSADVNNEMQSTLTGAYNGMQVETEDYREGFVWVCSAYQLFDGTYTNISAPVMLHLGTNGFSNVYSNEDYDTFYCRDKVQITEFHMNGNPSFTTKWGFNIGAFIRQQRQQRIIFQRPDDIPTDLGKEYTKIVYFVSEPISMYDFSKLDVHHLHINKMMDIVYDVDYNRGCYRPDPVAGAMTTNVRFSISNAMETKVIGSVVLGTKYSTEELKEGLPFHMPTKEELENITLYKAVEFSIENEDDKGERYEDAESVFVGKAVKFSELHTNDVLEAETSSNETYKANGLMTYNQRLHLYGVTTKFRDDITHIGLNDNIVRYNAHTFDSVKEYVNPKDPTIKWYLYDAVYKDTYSSAIYRRITYAKYNVKINSDVFSFVGDMGYAQSPVIPFMDSRLESIDIYWQANDKYYTANLKAFESKVYNMGMIDLWNYLRKNEEEINRDITSKVITIEEYNTIASAANTWITGTEFSSLNRLKVSNLANPIIFPPELDYQFDDEIVALGNNYKEISLAQEGQYPTYVFTKKGIWAMGIGSQSFYATQVPVHPDVAVCRHTLGIGNGVVYVAKDGIKVLSGRDVISISEPLRGHISHIDDLISVRSALGLGQSPNRLNTIYQDIYDGLRIVEASVEQDLFGPQTVLGYDRTNNEVIVCDTNYMHDDTSYVFSLNEKVWYRRSEKFYSFYRDYGCKRYDYIMSIENNGEHIYPIDNAVVWLCDEYNGGVPRQQASPITVDTQVFMLTRPMSIGNLGFKEIYHTALRGELRQNGNKLGTIGKLPVDPNYPHLGFYILASNDGGTWKMVGGKVWKESVTQVVLERIKQSYRYFALMFAGYVSDGFNITHIDLDGIDKYNNRQR